MSGTTKTEINTRQAQILVDIINGQDPVFRYKPGTSRYQDNLRALVVAGFLTDSKPALALLEKAITQAGRDYVKNTRVRGYEIIRNGTLLLSPWFRTAQETTEWVTSQMGPWYSEKERERSTADLARAAENGYASISGEGSDSYVVMPFIADIS